MKNSCRKSTRRHTVYQNRLLRPEWSVDASTPRLPPTTAAKRFWYGRKELDASAKERWRGRSLTRREIPLGPKAKAAHRRPPIAKTERPASGSGRLQIIVLQQPAQPLAANNRAFGRDGRLPRRQYILARRQIGPRAGAASQSISEVALAPRSSKTPPCLLTPQSQVAAKEKNGDQLTLSRLFALTTQSQVRRRFLSVFRGPKEYRTR